MKPNSRICTKCKIEKSFEHFETCNSKGFKYGLYPSCKDCRKESKKQYVIKNPETYRAIRRKHYLKNREKIILRTSEYAKAHPEMRRKVSLKHQYGLSEQEYDSMKLSQDNKCAICKKEPINHVLFVDHCHLTNKIRGLLCRKCNAVLGMCNDDVEILKESISYLEKEYSRGIS